MTIQVFKAWAETGSGHEEERAAKRYGCPYSNLNFNCIDHVWAADFLSGKG